LDPPRRYFFSFWRPWIASPGGYPESITYPPSGGPEFLVSFFLCGFLTTGPILAEGTRTVLLRFSGYFTTSCVATVFLFGGRSRPTVGLLSSPVGLPPNGPSFNSGCFPRDLGRQATSPRSFQPLWFLAPFANCG